MRKFLILACFGATVLLSSESAVAQNLIVNSGFENNPPGGFGNNIGHSIAPWTLGAGNSSNVVKVDGGLSYGNGGPRLDADPATGVGVQQHYLDIASGANDFYQAFTVPACGGAPGQVRAATFSGWFSTRDNLSGNGSVSIRAGGGASGAILAIANVSLPPPAPLTSATAPWVQVTGSVNVAAGTTISYVVSMDNNLNFDQAFLSFTGVTCVTSTVTLRKSWVNAVTNDMAVVALARASVPIESFTSTANAATEIDTDGTPAIGFQGEALTLSEVLGVANIGFYNPALTCTGGGTLSGTTLTVGATGAPIVCTYTNDRVSSDISVTKTNTPGLNGEADQPNDAVTGGSPTQYIITVTNAGPGTGNGSVLRDPISPGLTCTSVACAVGSGGAVCPPVTVATMQSGLSIPILPALSSLVFTLSCVVQ